MRRLITPEKVKSLDASEWSREVIILLGLFSDLFAREVTTTDYTAIRNFLLAQIIISNARRSVSIPCEVYDEYLPYTRNPNSKTEVFNLKTKTTLLVGLDIKISRPQPHPWFALYRLYDWPDEFLD